MTKKVVAVLDKNAVQQELYIVEALKFKGKILNWPCKVGTLYIVEALKF